MATAKKDIEPIEPVILSDFSGGINQIASITDLAPEECLEAHNVKFFRPDGCISPRPGRKWMVGMRGNPMASSMSSDIIGAVQFNTSAGTIYPMIATCCGTNTPARIGYLSGNSTDNALFYDLLHSDSSMYYDWVAGGWSGAVSGLSGLMYSADAVFIAPYESQVVMTWAPSGCDGRNVTALAPPLMWNGIGASATAIQISSEPHLGPLDDRSAGSSDRVISTMVAVSAARCGAFRGHLFLMNTVEMEMMSSDGSATGYFSAAWHPYRIRWNNPGASSIKSVVYSAGGPAWEYNDFADFDPGDGYGLTGYGVLGDEMLLFKRDKTFSISWVGGDEKFNFRNVSEKVGCIAHKSIAVGRGVAMWAGDDGIYMYDGQMPIRVSDKIKDIWSGINLDRRFLICGDVWPEMKQGWWSIPIGTSDRNSLGILADYTKGDPMKIAWSTASLSLGNLLEYTKMVAEDSATGMWGTCYGGWAHRYDEAINYETSGDHTDGTAVGTKMSCGMPYSWKSGWTTFEQPDYVKRVKRLKTTLNRNSYHLSVDVRKNWETTGIPAVRYESPLYGRSTNLSGDLIYDKGDFTVQGQSLQLHYYTSAGAATATPPPCAWHWTIHEVATDVDLMGTHFYGDI